MNNEFFLYNLFFEKRSFIILLFFLFENIPSNVLTVPGENIPNISTAIYKARFNDTIIVIPGIYKENIELKPGIVIFSKELFGAVLDGKGRGDVVKLSSESTISGFSIRNGNTGIISSRHSGNVITKCKIYKNRGSGIICTGNLPKIENNIIIYNEGSGIQALYINSGESSINHNTISFNGNNGVIFNGKLAVIIENNIITSNGSSGYKLNTNDKKTIITHNLFYGNHHFKFILPENNFSFDPLFVAPKRRTLNFSLQSMSKAIKKGNDNLNLGALFTNN